MHQYPPEFYRPFGGGGMFLILLIGFIGIACQNCMGCVGL